MLQRSWPVWWEWELELTPHLYKRMLDRSFSEVDLRKMLHLAQALVPDVVEGRYRAVTRFEGQGWEVIVEPDDEAKVLVVITAFPLG